MPESLLPSSVVEITDSSFKLDQSLLKFDTDVETWFKNQTKIKDAESLKQHVFAVTEEACKLFPYPCVKSFSYVGYRAARLSIYNHVLDLGRERKDAIFLDVGCCVGNDIRKLIDDGFPKENIIATDLSQGFWDIGHKLFKSTPESFPVKFIAGDMFDPSFLALIDSEDENSTIPASPPQLQTLTSLNPLRGRVSFIHASFFFHLFDEEGQLRLARLLAGLLDPRPGSTIFGCHVGLVQKGNRVTTIHNDKWEVFGHSPTSWTDMWDEVFGKGVVQVSAQLKPVGKPYYYSSEGADGNKRTLLHWSVVRL